MLINTLIFLFSVSFLIQLYYYFFYFRKLEKFKIRVTSSINPKISVLICAHNEEFNLKRYLPSILNQNYDDYEVIVVDDRSTDDTSEVVNSIQNERIKLIKIDNCEKGVSPKKNAITKGVEFAKGEFVLLTDADCYPTSKNWISDMLEQINDSTDLVLGYSPYNKKTGLLNKIIQFDTFLTAIQYLSFAISGKATMGVGRNLLIRKSAFKNVNGFEGFEHVLAGDDDIIVQKIANTTNTSICIEKDSFVLSEPKLTWLDWFKQKRRHLSVGVNYNKKSALIAGMFQQSLVWLYVLGITLIGVNFSIETIFTFLVFTTIRGLMFYRNSWKNLKVDGFFYMIPFLEMLYLLCYLLIGISVLFKNKRTWH